MEKIKFLLLSLFIGVISLATLACSSSTQTGKEIKGLTSVKGLNISVQTGTVGQDLAVELSGREAVLAFNKYADAILALKQGKVDATIMDESPALEFVKLNDDLMILEEPLEASDYAIALAKDSQELKEKIDTIISNLKKNKEIDNAVSAFQTEEDKALKLYDLSEKIPNVTEELIVGTEAGFPPYEYKIGDKIVGADIYLAQKIAIELNRKLVIKDIDFDSLLPSLNSGKLDFVIAGLSMTEERAKEVLFTNPYFSAKQVVVIRKADFKS